jgi:hypothetical protein
VRRAGRDAITADNLTGEEAHREEMRESAYANTFERDVLTTMQKRRIG